jgi:glutathione S-transferase
MHFELISFKLCPFVQRSIVMLRYKGVPFETTYVDLADPPEWFRALSPLGKVPVLRVDGETAIFESAVINEFLDEVTPGRLLPDDPVERAQARSWVAFGTETMFLLRDLTTAEDEAAFEAVVAALDAKIGFVEEVLGTGPWFAGAAFSLVDTAFAPFFRLLTWQEQYRAGLLDGDRHPRAAAWRTALLALDAVRDCVTSDYDELNDAVIRRRQGYFASLLPAGAAPTGPKSLY